MVIKSVIIKYLGVCVCVCVCVHSTRILVRECVCVCVPFVASQIIKLIYRCDKPLALRHPTSGIFLSSIVTMAIISAQG